MKYVTMIIIALLSSVYVNSSNLCWGYPTGGPRLQPVPIQKLKNCNCECWKYPHTIGDNNFYKCTVCGHRMLPETVLCPKNSPCKKISFKRWHEKPNKQK